ncbi:MAG: hypothetical protein GF329_04330 [Candidatus Lokiarchaeota archaeon]|nr:hypothetical protein [Candidatus Lokiarchaeota archaeon]
MDQNIIKENRIIKNFLSLYKGVRSNIENSMIGLIKDKEKKEFIDLLLIQLLVLKCLERKGFFNNDKEYIIKNLDEISSSNESVTNFSSYYDFLIKFIEFLGENCNRVSNHSEIYGNSPSVHQAVFLFKGKWDKFQIQTITIPDRYIYNKGISKSLDLLSDQKRIENLDLINLIDNFYSINTIDGYIIGTIFEKLLNSNLRKIMGVFYTPNIITSYMVQNTISRLLIDEVNNRFKCNFDSIDSIIKQNDGKIRKYLFERLLNLKILDPAMGSGHFLEESVDSLIDIHEKIWSETRIRGTDLKDWFYINIIDKTNKIKTIYLSQITERKKFRFLIKSQIIISNNIYGVDIDNNTTNIARARLYLSLIEDYQIAKNWILISKARFNLKVGNSLIGIHNFNLKRIKKKQLLLDQFIAQENNEKPIKEFEIPINLKRFINSIANELLIENIIPSFLNNINTILKKRSLNSEIFKEIVVFLVL